MNRANLNERNANVPAQVGKGRTKAPVPARSLGRLIPVWVETVGTGKCNRECSQMEAQASSLLLVEWASFARA